MAKKIGLFILIIFLSIILASIYGFLHNQVSYSISTEYFTKFKFDQFWSVKYTLDFPHMSAGLIGIASTWWLGLLIGLLIGIVGFTQPTLKIMWKSALGALIRVLGIAIGVGIVGILVGKFIIASIDVNWDLPAELVDRKKFLTAETMHNFSYLGGIIGLFFGIIYQLKIKKASAQQPI
jgi:hypothetical protein